MAILLFNLRTVASQSSWICQYFTWPKRILIFCTGMKLFKTHMESICLAVTFPSRFIFIITTNSCQPSQRVGTFSDGFYFQAIIGLVNSGTFSCSDSVGLPFRKHLQMVSLYHQSGNLCLMTSSAGPESSRVCWSFERLLLIQQALGRKSRQQSGGSYPGGCALSVSCDLAHFDLFSV